MLTRWISQMMTEDLKKMNGSKYTFGLNVGLIHIREINEKTIAKAFTH